MAVTWDDELYTALLILFGSRLYIIDDGYYIDSKGDHSVNYKQMLPQRHRIFGWNVHTPTLKLSCVLTDCTWINSSSEYELWCASEVYILSDGRRGHYQ